MVKTVLRITGEDNNNSVCSDSHDRGFVSYDRLGKSIAGIRDGDDVVIKGGEPLIHPDFFKILYSVKSRLPREIMILTNARMCSYSAFCSKLQGYGGLSFFVEVLGHDSALHDSLTRVKSSFKQTVEGIKNLVGMGFKVNALVSLLKNNYKNLGDIIELLKSLSVDNIILYNPAPKSNCFVNYDKIIPRISSIKNFVLGVLKENKLFIQLENFPYCFFSDYVDNVSNFFDYNDKLKIKVSKCDKCSYNGVCSGIFRRYVEKYGSAEVVPINDVKATIQGALNKVLKRSLVNISIDEMYILLRKLREKPNFWDAVYELGYPIPLVVLMLDEMRKGGLVDINAADIKLKVGLRQFNEKVIDNSKYRLYSNPKFCQLLVSQKSIEERIDFISEVCSSGGRIAILGDDDFISLSLASKGVFGEIFVFEIDDRITKRIKDIAKKNNLNVFVVKHDLRKGLPGKYCGKFDVFYTDSPYSPNGVELFVSRGVTLLKKKMKCHGFVSFSCEMPILQEVELAVQDSLTRMGLFIERKDYGGLNDIPESILRKYNDFFRLNDILFEDKKRIDEMDEWYLAALGRKEFMFHLLTTHYTKPLITGDFDKEIYYKDKPLDYYTNKKFIKRMKKEKAYLDF